MPLTITYQATHLAAGGGHACAITATTGEVWCWGLDATGELGDGTTTPAWSGQPEVVDGVSHAIQIAAGGTYSLQGHTCALISGGTVECWGADDGGELGNGSTTPAVVPTPVHVTGLSGVMQIAAGFGHTCAVVNPGGHVKCWGDNFYGQLGIGVVSPDVDVPTTIPGLSGVSQVSLGANFSCALVATNNRVKCWGWNGYGELGNAAAVTNQDTPLTVMLASGSPLNQVISIAAGEYHMCALRTSGRVWCWGDNADGELGTGTTTSSDVNPGQVVGASSVNSIASGGFHSCAIISAHHALCWGLNTSGQLGRGNTTNSNVAVSANGPGGVQEAAAGSYFTCLRYSGHNIKCFGDNGYGQRGTGSTTPGHTTSPGLNVVLSETVLQVAAGDTYTCALLGPWGRVSCWGFGQFGSIGNGGTGNSSTPLMVVGLTGATMITAGTFTGCALLMSTQVKCWGWNQEGQVGNQTVTNALVPVTVIKSTGGPLTNVSQISGGGYRTCAVVQPAGGVECWGDFAYNVATTGQTGYYVDATPVVSLTGVTQIAAGYYDTCALIPPSTVECWGWNLDGNLGNGTSGGISLIPVTVSGLSGTITELAAGWWQNCVLFTTHQAKCWGNNDAGQVGDGSFSNALTPATVLLNANTPFSNIVQITGGGDHTCLTTTSHYVWCWGLNNFGQLGDGNLTTSSYPRHVLMTTRPILGVTAGQDHSCVLLGGSGTHAVQCWGDDQVGELGNGATALHHDSPVIVVGY